MTKLRLFDIKPNDIDQAVAFYRQCQDDGTWSADVAEALIHRQDDPDELIAAIAREGRPSRL